MHDALFAACANVLGPAIADGRHPVVKHQRTTGGSAFYRIYDTRDGRQLVLAGQEPKFVHALLNALGRPDLEPLCARGPGAHQQPVIDFLRETFRQRDLRGLDGVPARRSMSALRRSTRCPRRSTIRTCARATRC